MEDKVAIVAYGRFNPPHIGHEKLINAMASMKGDVKVLYLSTTINDKKDPLNPTTKLEIVKSIAGNKVTVLLDTDKTIKGVDGNGKAVHGVFKVPTSTLLDGCDKVMYVAGGDRQEIAMAERMGKAFKDKTFEVVSDPKLARDPNADNASGYSATKMREFADKNDFESFKKGMAFKKHIPDSLIKKAFKEIQEKHGINAESLKESKYVMSFKEFVGFFERFQQELIPTNNVLEEANVNAHSTHIEELCFTQGFNGLKQSLAGLDYIIKHAGKSSDYVSIKFDGAPAVCMGRNAEGKFFVSTKNILTNKNPEKYFYYSSSQIDDNYNEGKDELKNILKALLSYGENVFPQKNNIIIQGDLLFCVNGHDKEVKTIEGTKCYVFQPNTLAYAVPVDSDLGKSIGKAKVGLVIHTEYKWDGKDPSTIDKSKTSIKKESYAFKDDSSMFVIDAVSDVKVNNAVQYGVDEYKRDRASLNELLRLGRSVNWGIITSKSEISEILSSFINSYIRTYKPGDKKVHEIDAKQKFQDFIAYIDKKHQDALYTKDKEGNRKLKGPKGQATANAKFAVLHALNANEKELVQVFDIFNRLTAIKLNVISHLNKLGSFKKYIVVTSENDYKGTDDEGYVLTKTRGQGSKIVDRNVFSYNNFNREGKGFGK